MTTSIAPFSMAALMALAVACAPPPPRSSVVASAGSSPPSASVPPPPAPKDRGPVAEREPVKDVYHGIEIADPYRWLEDTSSERVKAFAKAQNERARRFLDAVPQREAVRGRLKQILSAKFAAYRHPAEVAGTLFALKLQPPRQQAILVTMAGVGGVDAERILVDPDALDASGHTSIDWFRPSPDGQYVAVSLGLGNALRRGSSCTCLPSDDFEPKSGSPFLRFGGGCKPSRCPSSKPSRRRILAPDASPTL